MHSKLLLSSPIICISVFFFLFLFNNETYSQKKLTLQGKTIAINAGHNKAIYPYTLKNGDARGVNSIYGKEKMYYPGNPLSIAKGKYRGVIRESDLTYDISKKLQYKIEKLGGICIQTRVEPCKPTWYGRKVNLLKRSRIANKSKADILIDIHLNSGKKYQRGYQLFIPCHFKKKLKVKFIRLKHLKLCKKSEKLKKSLILAKSMDHYLYRFYLESNGIPPSFPQPIYLSKFKVIGNAKMPALIIECGYMTRRHEMDLLADEDFRNRMTDYIVAAIISYFKKV